MSINQHIDNNSRLITERVSSVVYHFCGVNSCYHICDSNEFILSSVFRGSADSEVNRGAGYYLSLTRQSSHKLGFSRTKDVRIQLDGDALNQRYKGGPVDYWGVSMGKQYYYKKDSGNDYLGKQQSRTENEDRVFSNEPVIPNASRYIVRIDIYLDKRFAHNNILVWRILHTEFRDRVFVYDNMSDFEARNANTINDEILTNGDAYSKYSAEDYTWKRMDANRLKSALRDLIDFILFGEDFAGNNRKDNKEAAAKLLNQYGLREFIFITDDLNPWIRLEDLVISLQNVFDTLRENPLVYKKAMRMFDDYRKSRNISTVKDAYRYKKELMNPPSKWETYDYEKKVKLLFFIYNNASNIKYGIPVVSPSETSIWKLIPNERRYFVDDVIQYGVYPSHESSSDVSFKKYLQHIVKSEMSVDRFMDILNKLKISEDTKDSILGGNRFVVESVDFFTAEDLNYLSASDKNKALNMFRKNGK